MAKKKTYPDHRANRAFGKNLAAWRHGANLTVRTLAIKLCKPHSFVYKCEMGDRRTEVREFILWCRACNIDPARAIRQIAKTLPE